MEPKLKDLENSQPIHIAKTGTACSEKNIKSVAEQPFDKEIHMGVNHRLNQLPQEKHCHFELKGTELG